MNKLKKWNWGIFFFIVLLSFLGALPNKGCPDIFSCLILTLIFGVPFGLIWAYISRED